MTWAKVDDHANEHRKQIAAGGEACWLWTCGLMYANRQTARDGFIPAAVVGMLYPYPPAKTAKLAARLVAVGLWVEADGGYRIHQFTIWNQTKEQREHELEEGRRRAAKSYEQRKANGINSSPEEVRRRVTEESGVLQNSSGSISTPIPLPERDPPTPSVLAPQGADRDIGQADLDSFSPNPAVISAKRKTPERKSKPAQWRRFPHDFEPDDTHRKIALQLGLSLQQQLAEIRDHEFAKPKTDAAATFRTWLRNAPKFGAGTVGAPRAHRPDPRNEAQDRNADHDTRAALESARKVREMHAFADKMKAAPDVR